MKFLIVLTLIFPSFLYCQDNSVIRGRVTDAENGEVLTAANVYIEEIGIGSATDSKGFFLIASLPGGAKLNIKISYIGYSDTVIAVRTITGKVSNINVSLTPMDVELETIEKVGSFNQEINSANLGFQSITLKELERLPKSVELDVIKALQYIPGVQSTGDVSARFYVRGSPSNQNLVQFNGSTIYNPFHGFGMFGVIDPEIVNHVDFYKGGFTAEHGERISSILSIVTKDGNKNRFAGKIGASLLSAKALLEGPLPKGSYIISARKSYSDYVMKKFLNDTNAPINFYDVSFKANYLELGKENTTRLSFHGFLSGDRVDYNNNQREDYKWNNKVLGINWLIVPHSPVFINVNYSYSNFIGEVIPNNSLARPLKNVVTDHHVNSFISYVQSNGDELGIGITIQEVSTSLQLQNFVDVQSDIKLKGTHLDVFAKYKLQRFNFFGLDIGTRINAARILGGTEYSVEPRVSLTIIPSSKFSIKSAWGIYTQELTTLADEDIAVAVFEPWSVIPEYLPLARSIHYLAGISYTPSSKLLINLEGYYKVLQNMPTFNENKIFDTDRDLIASDGISYGLEFQSTANLNDLNVNIAYTISSSEKTVDGITYPPRYDSKHNLNLIFDYDFGNSLRANLTWVYKSGYPYTQLLGYYNKLFLDRDLSVLGLYNPFTILSERNKNRLPSYHRLDFNISKKMKLYGFDITLDLSILNLYNRKNLFYFKRETGERVNMLPFFPTISFKAEF